MVHITLSLAVAFSLFLSQEAIAAPTADNRFYFSDWTDSIIANPETALTSEQAVQAFLDTLNSANSSPAAKRSYLDGLEKRQTEFNYGFECLQDWYDDVASNVSPPPPVVPILRYWRMIDTSQL